jgi:hypothetical protein
VRRWSEHDVDVIPQTSFQPWDQRNGTEAEMTDRIILCDVAPRDGIQMDLPRQRFSRSVHSRTIA